MSKELLIGCGSNRIKRLGVRGHETWDDLVTLDINLAHAPDVVHDLEKFPWPFDDNTFDELHAYDVCEHVTGYQGDVEPFFAFFTEAHRILKPGGLFFGIVPDGPTLTWGDPSHKRVINTLTLSFLSQEEYSKQVGVTAMSDFRHIYHADFRNEYQNLSDYRLQFVLRCMSK